MFAVLKADIKNDYGVISKFLRAKNCTLLLKLIVVLFLKIECVSVFYFISWNSELHLAGVQLTTATNRKYPPF